jgi:hypothetical protein
MKNAKTDFALPRCWKVAHAASLETLLTWCLDVRKVDRLLLATRLDKEVPTPTLLKPEVESRVHELFSDRMLETTVATAWPGTQLIGHAGKVYLVEFDRTVLRRMVAAENRLGAWTQWNKRPLPEDVCVYRVGDRTPVLVSVTHDDDAWIFHNDDVSVDVASPASIILPADLIPPPPNFFVGAAGR